MVELSEEIRSYVIQCVAEGFDDEENIIESAIECFEIEQTDEERRGEIARFATEQMAEHLRTQARWPRPTDCDRLDWAFEELERAGIVARQNFTCCSTCGHYEIWDEIRQAKQEHPIEGYVFYHMQDTERAVTGGGLFLAYGAVEDSEKARVAVGKKIVLAMERAGLRTEWNGNGNTRILLVDLDWKRRR